MSVVERLAGVGLWRIDLAACTIAASPVALAILGHDETTPQAGDFDPFAHVREDDRLALCAAVDRCVSDGTPFDLELEIATAAGRRRWVRAIGEAARSRRRNAVRLHGVLKEISEHKLNEQALLDASHRLTTALESMTDCFVTLDRDWRFTYVNRRAAEVFGRDRASLLGECVWEVFPQARGSVFQQEYERAMEQGRTARFEAYFEPLDLWAEINAYPSAQGLAIYFRNINARKQAEREHAELLDREFAAQREVESARLQFRALFESVPGLFLVLSAADLSIVAVSEAYLHATYTRREGIVGQHIFEVFPDDPADPLADGVRNLRTSLERVRQLGVADAMAVQRYPVRRPDAQGGGFEERYWSPLNSPVLDADGQVTYIIHRVEDVTEFVRRSRHAKPATAGGLPRRTPDEQMEVDILTRSRELQRLNEHLRAAQRVAGLGSWEMRLHDGSVVLSEETCHILGIGDGSLGRSFEGFLTLVHPDDRARIVAHHDCSLRGETPPREVEYRIIRPDGMQRDMRALSELVRDEQGRPVLLAGTVQDITERKAADVRVQAQISRLQLLQRITRAISDRLDVDSILRIVTDRLHKQLPLAFCAVGLRHADGEHITVASVGLLGRALARRLALDEGHRLHLADNGLAACLSGEVVHEPDLTAHDRPFHRRLGAAGLGSAVLTPLCVEGDTLGVLLCARAATHAFTSDECDFVRQLCEHVALAMRQAELHKALLTAYEDLRRTQNAVLQHERLRAVGQMASGIAHDINNAIAPVTLYAESLLHKEVGLSVEGRRQLEVIQLAIDDVAQTVSRLREFYRQDGSEEQHRPVSLNVLAQQSLELTQARWRAMPQRAGIAIQVETDLQDDLPLVAANDTEIREALVNLIFNAVDAMPAGGTLTLRSRAERQGNDTAVSFEISDTGIGMDEDTRRRAVEPFFTTKGERGTGLGLAMVYGTMQRHRASFEIDSTPGRGTTVRLSFPVERHPAAQPEGLPRHATALPPLRLLVVDDEPLVLRSLVDILEAEGHQVTTATSGREALDRFCEQAERGTAYDAVITDLGMPHMDGQEVAAAVKARAPATPVVMVTGWGRRMSDEGDKPRHVDHLVPKPPRLDQLRAALACCAAAA